MIQILPCATCSRSLVLPPGVSLHASIECPHCEKEFVIGDMLASQFGHWRVKNDPGAAPGNAGPAPHAVGEASESEEFHLAPIGAINPAFGVTQVVSATATEIVGDEGEMELSEEVKRPSKPKADWSNFEPITHEQYERMKRKSRSPWWSMIQIVLGGLAAFPIALLLLWHLVGKDIAGAGPAVSRYVPWIVPEQFRAIDAEGDDDEDDSDSSSGLAKGDSGFKQFDDVLSGTEEPDEGDGDRSGSDMAEVLAQEQMGSDESSGLANAGSLSKGGMSSTVTSQNQSGSQGKRGLPSLSAMDGSQAAAPEENTGGTSEPNLSSSDTPPNPDTQNVFVLIRRCELDLDAWRTAVEDKDGDLKRLARSVYKDFADLAKVFNGLPEGNPVRRSIRDSMQAIGRSVKREGDVQNLIEQGTEYWLEKYGSQNALPLACIVEIGEVSETAVVWKVSTTESSEIAGVDRIVIPRFLAPTLIAGQRLLLLGMVEQTEPAEESAPSSRLFTANYLHAL